MEKIPFDIDRYHTEILFQAHPDVAFVAKLFRSGDRTNLKRTKGSISSFEKG